MLALLGSAPSEARAQGQPITFSAIADIPYSSSDEVLFQEFVDDHNLHSPSDFFVHVGDIKDESVCVEPRYTAVSDLLGQLAVPSFIVPGDNEWNDCSDPDAAWQLWEAAFTDFEQGYCGTPAVEEQGVRHENFAFSESGVLFVGVNVVGGSVHDSGEWATRLQQDADWVDAKLQEYGDQVRAAVVFGHAGPGSKHAVFFDSFEASAAQFAKPVLYVMGDEHHFVFDNPFSEPNMSRITIEQDDPPLQVTVTLDPQAPFAIERDPWPSGSAALNRPPCVDAGPDQAGATGEDVPLPGFASDDGVPVGNGVSLAWSQLSGPAAAVVADPSAADTTAVFPGAGNYVMRLTADDGELTGQDELSVEVASGGPTLAVDDVSAVEGHSGSSPITFTVSLLEPTGGPVTVDYATSDGSALSGTDYQAASGTLSFSGSTTERTVEVLVLGDLEPEAYETFTVELTDASGAELADGTGTGTIVDDDAPAIPVVSAFAPTSGPVGATIRLSGGSFSGASSVSFGGTPASFTVVSDSTIDAVVPGGASSGVVGVTNAAGTGSSAESFVVEFALTLATIGSGAVAADPPGGSHPQGTAVTLTASPSPSPGWSFQHWTGDLTGSANPDVVTLDSSRSVTAVFSQEGSESVALSLGVDVDANDAEEEIGSGAVDLTSSDLELGQESGAQQVGLRFEGVEIPQGAVISSASVSFTVDEVSGGASSLEIRGQASDDAAAFQAAPFDVSGRPATGAMIPWSPPDWPSVGAAGPDQRTPDLSALVQEIVARPGWSAGNALVLVVTGSGTRTAESARHGAAAAPRLDVVYQLPEPAAPLGFSAGTALVAWLAGRRRRDA